MSCGMQPPRDSHSRGSAAAEARARAAGTWSGRAGENWDPAASNILQVLISIQGLVLVDNPFYLEPGFEKQAGTREGAAKAMRYNEGAQLFTLRALGRCLSGALPHTTGEIIRPAMRLHGPRLVARIRGLLAKPVDSSQGALLAAACGVRRWGVCGGALADDGVLRAAFQAAGFLQTLAKLLPGVEQGLIKVTGMTSMEAAAEPADEAGAGSGGSGGGGAGGGDGGGGEASGSSDDDDL